MGRIKSNSPIWALGAMSGTSLDGIDSAMLRTDGHEIFAFGRSEYRAYSETERGVLARALGQWSGPEVQAASELCETLHIKALKGYDGADLIGFHGQTLAHDPHGKGTLQVGNGAVLAKALGCPVIWDFRSEDVRSGGEGAPLAPFFHHACARFIKAKEPVAFLNLGGVGNLTWVDPTYCDPAQNGALLAFDTGPANAPLNDLMQRNFNQPFDKDGQIAKGGSVNMDLLARFLENPYFQTLPPKSLDRDHFQSLTDQVAALDVADAAATFCAICAAGVGQGMLQCPKPPKQLLVSGGGRKNPVLMRMLAVELAAAFDCALKPVEAVGLDGDMLEAQAFAYLAVRVARGLPTSCPGTTGVGAAVSGGICSLPTGTIAES